VSAGGRGLKKKKEREEIRKLKLKLEVNTHTELDRHRGAAYHSTAERMRVSSDISLISHSGALREKTRVKILLPSSRIKLIGSGEKAENQKFWISRFSSRPARTRHCVTCTACWLGGDRIRPKL